MLPWSDITAQISNSTGLPFAMEKAASIGGGCINEAHRIEGNGRRFFVKLNHADSLAMFEAEAMGLQEIYRSHTLRVPVPVCWGKNKSKSWLVLEYLEMGNVSSSGAAVLGARLAAMHNHS